MHAKEITLEMDARGCMRECLMALCELIGLLLVALMTQEPAGYVHVYFAATNFYALVEENLAQGYHYLVALVGRGNS